MDVLYVLKTNFPLIVTREGKNIIYIVTEEGNRYFYPVPAYA